ncbi:hypothetical protein GXM_01769 [Nostoc sphaeroides CCNUC1]|uniref:Uncharacterized protein n=1 Tax=Nostoc sphaeroides CCNUC1 TaxID=2653204 RepID=A0A5P8VVZ0_9NOSO|nr:hypothetical protein GXM_01769 [Nostoc sphaeroides CCNUC1]
MPASSIDIVKDAAITGRVKVAKDKTTVEAIADLIKRLFI